MVVDIYKMHVCVWSVFICLNQEIIENCNREPQICWGECYKIILLKKEVKQELEFWYSILGLVCIQNAAWNFCLCYSEKGLVSVFRVCFGGPLFRARADSSNCYLLPSFYPCSASLCGGKLLWLKGILAEGFSFSLFVFLPCFYGRSLNHSSLHSYTKSISGLTTEVVQGAVCSVSTAVSSSLYSASQVALNVRIKGLVMKSCFFLLFCSAEHWVPTLLVCSH